MRGWRPLVIPALPLPEVLGLMSMRGAPSFLRRWGAACLQPPERHGRLLFLHWRRQTGVLALLGSSGGEEKAREDGEGGWQAVRSEYDGMDAFASDR